MEILMKILSNYSPPKFVINEQFDVLSPINWNFLNVMIVEYVVGVVRFSLMITNFGISNGKQL